MSGHRVRAEIDLDALEHNLAVVRGRVGGGVRVLLVVKADAYGHGAVTVARHAERCGVAALGIATAEEARELRAAGVGLPLVLLGLVLPEEVREVVESGVEVALQSAAELAAVGAEAARRGARARVHVNVDTGMGRLGVLPGAALELLKGVAESPGLELAGVMTHLASPRGAADPESAVQLERFAAVLAAAGAAIPPSAWIHVASTAGVFTGLVPLFDTVRVGISAYGLLPGHEPGHGLRPVLRLESRVVLLKDLPPGSAVGYSSTWRTTRGTRIATVPAGYEDGVPRRASNRGHVLVRGCRAPIVGTISMDYLTVDVGHVPEVRVGDVVTLVGRDGAESIGIEELAEAADTVAYEVLCSIGRRVPRVATGGADLALPARPPRTAEVAVLCARSAADGPDPSSAALAEPRRTP